MSKYFKQFIKHKTFKRKNIIKDATAVILVFYMSIQMSTFINV